MTPLPTVHFHEQLVEGVFLLALVAKVPSASLPSHCVDLVDEKDAGGIFSSGGKRVPYLISDRAKRNHLNNYINQNSSTACDASFSFQTPWQSQESFSPVLTLAGPTPTNISWNSEPLTVMKGTFASPAVALASNVLPVPGGPDNTAP